MMLARCTATVFALSPSRVGDLLVRQPVANQLQHLELARRQAAFARRSSAAGRATARIEHRLAGGDLLDRGREIEIESRS